MSATSIVGYTYLAAQLCPCCVMDAVAQANPLFSASTATDVELFLDEAAEYLNVDRQDEKSFDSGDFPKVVFGSQIESYEFCNDCGTEIV